MATNNVEEDQCMCPIHCDILVEPVTLNCQHWFCKDCLRRYVDSKNGVDPDCPECREPLDLPPDGVDGLTVNFKMREICNGLLEKKQKQNQMKCCHKHPGEVIERFCCECLVAVCEECEDEYHKSHKHRSIGSAWKIVGKKIEDKFRAVKEALAVSDKDLHASQYRKDALINHADTATAEIASVVENLYENLKRHSATLHANIQVQLGKDLEKEDEYFRNNAELGKTAERIEAYENRLRTLLSSGGHSITEDDLDALSSLHNNFNPVERKAPPPRHITRTFHPSIYVSKLLNEGFGSMLTEEEARELKGKERAAESGFHHDDKAAKGDGERPAHGRNTASKLSVPFDDEEPLPTHLSIRTKSRTILPPSIVHPYDVKPFQLENHFLVSDMTGAVSLVTAPPDYAVGEPRCINLKPSVSDFFLGASGIATSSDKQYLFSCNQHERCLEQYDIQSVCCVKRFSIPEYLNYPRCICLDLMAKLLFVSDAKGGVKVMASNTGRLVADVGSSFLLTPTGVATDLKYRLYVADELQSRIYVFDTRKLTNNEPLYQINTSFRGVPVNCHGISVGRNGNILVSVTKESSPIGSVNLLMELNEQGQLLRTGGWELRKPRGLAVYGKVTAVADSASNCIVTYHI